MHFNADNFNLAAFETDYYREERDRERLDALRPVRRTDTFRAKTQAEIDAAAAARRDGTTRAYQPRRNGVLQ